MPITQLNFNPSAELEKELAFFKETPEGEKIYSDLKNQEDVVRWVESNADYMDLRKVAEEVPHGRLLDVGVGWGLSSAYLRIKGFQVVSLEPSIHSCRNMEIFFHRLGLQIPILCGTAETMGQIRELFDLVVFWSSLHHCDDPVLALANARKIINQGGRVLLYEPVLRFYRTKKWFYRMLIENPKKVGHYGGNEHIYRYQEYLDFLKQAGFGTPSTIPSLRYSAPPKRAVWDGPFRWPLKRLYYWLTRRLCAKGSLTAKWLIHLSLLTPLIAAEKPSSS